jgi:hypothetical protein
MAYGAIPAPYRLADVNKCQQSRASLGRLSGLAANPLTGAQVMGWPSMAPRGPNRTNWSEISLRDVGDPDRLLVLVRRHAGVGRGLLAAQNIGVVTLPNVLVGAARRLDLLEQFTSAADGAVPNA